MSTSPKTLAFVYLAHDGITSYYAGIGTYSMCFLYSLPRIIDALKKEGVVGSLHLVTPHYKPKFYGYNEEIKQTSLKLCKKYRGQLIEVDNGMRGLDSYGDVENWDKTSANAAVELARLADRYDELVVIAVDTPFMRVGEYLFEKHPELRRRVKVVLSPQSTELIHRTGNRARLAWEKARFKAVGKYVPALKVSYSSNYLKKHFREDYGVPLSWMVRSMSGILFESPRYKKWSEARIKQVLVKNNIPLDRKIVFTVGRLEPYKGFDKAIQLTAALEELNPYLVIVGISYIPNNPLLPKLLQMKKTYGIEGNFIYHLDLELPLALWQWKNCIVSTHISQFEPFGLAPVEARFMAKTAGPVVLVSDQGGLKEQIVSGKDGYRVNYYDDKAIAAVARKILNMNTSQKAVMRKAAYENVARKYNAHHNIFEFMAALSTTVKPAYRKLNRGS